MNPNNKRKKLIFTLKWLVVLVCFIYAWRTDFFSIVRDSFFDARLISLGLFFQFIIVLAQSTRWKIIHAKKGFNLSTTEAVRISLTSHFFSLLGGGSAGTDIVRGVYAARATSSSPIQTTYILFMDRGAGLGMTLLAGYTSLVWKSGALPDSIPLGMAAHSATALLPLVSLLVFVFLLIGFRIFKKEFTYIIFLSFITILSTVFWVYFNGILLNIPLTFQDFLFIVPIATVVSAIPILPLGIGTGQLAYFQLFELLGTSGKMGVSLCTLLQMQMLIFNLLGVFAFITNKPQKIVTHS